MTANLPSNLDKAAALLRRLPSTSLTKVLEMIGAESSDRLRIAIETISNRPDLSALDEQVLQEFRDMQREVRESMRGSPKLERMHASNPASASIAEATKSEIEESDEPPIDASVASETDVIQELTKTPPAVLATALQKETPRAMALVLRQLPTEYTGSVLEHLSAELRQQIFMLLAMKSTIHPAVTQSVLHAVNKVCKTVDLSVVGQVDERFKTLIGILQMVEREERLRLMEALSEQDEELAALIDDNLYDYSDLLRIQDRSVQKLLTQLELKVVAIALKSAPADISEKVMKNLSERVRATLTEEMELLNTVAAAKVEEARKEIANVIRLQDKDGTLMWIEA